MESLKLFSTTTFSKPSFDELSDDAWNHSSQEPAPKAPSPSLGAEDSEQSQDLQSTLQLLQL